MPNYSRVLILLCAMCALRAMGLTRRRGFSFTKNRMLAHECGQAVSTKEVCMVDSTPGDGPLQWTMQNSTNGSRINRRRIHLDYVAEPLQVDDWLVRTLPDDIMEEMGSDFVLHSDEIHAISYSHDGLLLATASWDKTIMVRGKVERFDS